MNKYLPFETSAKLEDMLGYIDTELAFSIHIESPITVGRIAEQDYGYPAISFGELVLLFPKILEAKGNLAFGGTTDSEQYIAHRICFSYIDSGGDMEAVAKVLEEIIG